MGMMWQKLMVADAGVTEVTYVGASTGYALDASQNNAPLSFHANTAADDLAIVWLRTDDSASNKVVPTGWTLIGYTSGTTSTRAYGIAKKLASGDISSPPNLLSANDTHAWICMTFRGGNFNSISPQDYSANNASGWSSEVITSGSGVAPVIVFAGVGCKNDYTGAPSLGGSETDIVEVNGLGTSQSNVAVAMRIFNASPIDLTRAAWTGATDNTSMEFYLNV